MPGFYAPKALLDKKPAHGAPCNRCGLCCVATVCPLGRHVLNQAAGPCPALQQDAEGASCGLVADPMRFARQRTLTHGVEAMRQAAVVLIGSGTGCDARFNGEWKDDSFYSKLTEWDRVMRSQVRRARVLWGL